MGQPHVHEQSPALSLVPTPQPPVPGLDVHDLIPDVFPGRGRGPGGCHLLQWRWE